ncbi:glycine cleavage system aminomethyltransferase GcvT [Shouchella lonarensis]|uniref:Aminomethyltransferase n=1 Tax=Shouchella lonarensis TaxID=1464122 RepID=A0A1G6GPL5_9BACI|nr:glycine cleavage system aminomethyltransferase GcvT [Shouchella lonarensis]SDB83136.1 aminomethyltransferase [Shouchella lonarensis]
MTATLKQTPLYEESLKAGAKMIDFGGWALPVSYSSITAEHEAVRNDVGLFDVSHMGEVRVEGKDATNYLQKLLTNDVTKLTDGRAQYHAMCTETGGTVDDLIVYRRAEGRYLLVLNAANIDSDLEWMTRHLEGDVCLTNVSAETALLAVQGPQAEALLQTLTSTDLTTIRPFRFQEDVNIGGVSVLAARTGYTGEDGFELYVSATDASRLWTVIMEAGAPFKLLPCGLGARDTLRFEAALPLYGQELTTEISPIEAGIGFAVKTDKDTPFMGQEVLRRQKDGALTRQLVGIEMIERGIPRTGYAVFAGEEEIGFVTTGTRSPTLGKNIGLALLDIRFTTVDTEVMVAVRNKHVKARVVATPFYKRKK